MTRYKLMNFQLFAPIIGGSVWHLGYLVTVGDKRASGTDSSSRKRTRQMHGNCAQWILPQLSLIGILYILPHLNKHEKQSTIYYSCYLGLHVQ